MSLPEIAVKKSAMRELEPGTYHWCACGRSQTQPFCDGSHHGSEFAPIAIEITERQTVWLCQCKRSAKGAFCDGTHKSL